MKHFISSLSVINANTPPCKGRVSSRKFLSLLLILALGVGNVWGADCDYSDDFSTVSVNTSYSTRTTTAGWNATYTAVEDYTYNSKSYRAFKMNGKKGGLGKITSPLFSDGCSAISFVYGQAHKDAIKFDVKVYDKNNVELFSKSYSASKPSAAPTAGVLVEETITGVEGDFYVVFANTSTSTSTSNGYRVSIMNVCITSASSGSTEPAVSLTADPTTIDFGTVYEGATVADKTVAVNFENLNGDVTYSGLSTPFTATGAISATGDKITISADASTIGEYSQTLTIASTADSKTAEVTVKMNVVEKPAPTGTFTLHTGELIEGDYVIYYSGKAMKAEVASNRLQYVEVTPSNNEIVDPAAAAIWHIAKSGANWTVYNNNKGYAAGTGTKSQAGLVTNLTGDNANKAAWTVTASGNAYEFVNVWNKSKSVNANLRNNTTYGFACYATGTGGALSLYRKAGAKYNVTVNSTTNGSVTASPTSAEAGATIALTVAPDAGYVLDALTVTDASSNTIEVADNKFTMPAADVTIAATFKENEKPAATLTLSKNGVTEDITGYKQDDKVELPSITSDCVKEFVGWSANPTCNVAPEYAAGDSYTLAADAQTLYAVYATAGAGETLTITPSAVSGSEDPYTFTIDAAGYSLTAKKNSGSTAPTYTSNEVRVYAKGTVSLTAPKAMGTIVFNISTNGKKRLAPITASVGTIATQAVDDATVTWTGDATEVTFTVGDIAEFGSENTKAGQLCFGTITVTTAGSYSNYSTTCAAALANPTFSVAEGKYTEAKSVEITATEGTVYYTTDGTTPTASSTQYTGAIALNDCGEYTIKAIAISADSQSDVVSATYTIKLPLTNSQAAPYTEAEAIAVYDGDCYDNQDVYVKGTVKTATFYSSSSTYTITLTNGFQFYKFYKDGSKATFTDGDIKVGDVLVACGKLSKYNTTYQLAEGCYLVEHEPYTEPKTDISNTEATAYTVEKAFELISDIKSDLDKEVYVKGLVAVAPTSNPTADGQMTYKISDNGENTGNVLTVYLGLNLNGEKFTSKNDVQQGDYVVVKGKLLDYNSTYELNKGNQLVQHVKAATITIADITMEVGETKTIAATIVPAAAKTEVAYSIKAGSDDCITLSENNITAKAEGTATIVATIATAEGEYMGKTVEFKVTVTPKSEKTNVVILAEYKDKWYALVAAKGSANNTLGAVEVNYVNGVILDFAGDKASITWERAIVGNKAAFKNGTNYMKGATGDTDLILETSAFEWEVVDGKYLVESKRTFLYNKAGYFKNYDANTNAGKADYSAWPVVTAVEFMNSVTTPSVEKGIFSVADGEFVQFSTGNLQYEVGTNTWSFASEQYEVIGGEAYIGSNNTNYGMNVPGYTGKLDLFAWSCDGKFGVNPSNADADYTGEFADWGNLVNEEGWYTLTQGEMSYLLNRQKDGKKLWTTAELAGQIVLILLPDNWNTETELVYGYVPATGDFDKNVLTIEKWKALEEKGAVLLPSGGSRTGGYGNKIGFDGETVETEATKLDANDDYFYVDNVGDYGYYWLNTATSSEKCENCASYLLMPGFVENDPTKVEDDEYTRPQVPSREKRRGNSVRLVKEVTPNHTRTVTSGDYGTICLPNGGLLLGASAFSVAKMEGTTILLDEVGTTMVAGTPYVVFPNTGAKKLYVFYTDNANAPAGYFNGLYGSYDRTELTPNDGNYIMLPGNKYAEVTGDRVYVAANRAYFKVGEISTIAQAPAPGVRRIAIGQAPQVATGMENIDASVQPVKMIIDGQLYILRGEKMYDAQGKLVK